MEKVNKLLNYLKDRDIEAYLCINIENSNRSESFYFSGFTGSLSALIIDPENKYIITDSRYYEQAIKETEYELIKLDRNKEDLIDLVDKHIKKYKKIGINYSKTSYKILNELIFRNEKVQFVDIEEIISEIRSVKSGDEIEKIKKSVEIAQKALMEALNYLKAGITEKQFAARLEYEMKVLGSEKPAFIPPIVASGYRSAMPHGRASDKVIEYGELVVIDFGAVYNGYCSDITRTVAVGEISNEAYKIYEIVEKAQKEALSKMKAGMTGKEIDALARNIIEKAGYGYAFGHSLGHGIGVDGHEAPILSSRNVEEIKNNVVVTVEPGIYLSGKFGVRIEDDIILTDQGAILLSKQDELIVV